MGSDGHLPVASDSHALHRMEDAADQVLPVNADAVPKKAVVPGLEAPVYPVGQAFLRVTNDLAPVERMPESVLRRSICR